VAVKPILIDTNIYTHAFKGDGPTVSVLQEAREIGLCVISIGELLSGFKGGKREKENRKELAEFLDAPRVRVFDLDEDTGEYYATILDSLRRKGTPIPTNDLWIAAVALQYGLPLFSKDRHFERVSGLVLVA
jgi:tRNA(fMet)-specific endonuclease VapC